MKSTVASLVRRALPRGVHEALFRLAAPCVSDDLKHRYANGLSMWWALENLDRCGFHPAQVIDVGACVGDWTRRVRKIWPSAHCLMIEPQPDRADRLRGQCGPLVTFEPALVGAQPNREVVFHMDDLGGSSIHEQIQNKATRQILLSMTTLDELLHDKWRFPIFLKADVQGAELEVLRGAENTLGQVEAILLEVSLLAYNLDAPLFAEVVAFLADRGFLVYDVCSMHRRQSDDTAFQLDVIFVRAQSRLRDERPFFMAKEG